MILQRNRIVMHWMARFFRRKTAAHGMEMSGVEGAGEGAERGSYLQAPSDTDVPEMQ